MDNEEFDAFFEGALRDPRIRAALGRSHRREARLQPLRRLRHAVFRKHYWELTLGDAVVRCRFCSDTRPVPEEFQR